MFTIENVPSYNEVKQKLDKFIKEFGSITNVRQLRELMDDVKYSCLAHDIEINGEPFQDIADKIKDNEIEWIRYENFDCLDYIYVYIRDGKIKDVSFDVWSDIYECDVIHDIYASDFNENNYNKAVEQFCSSMNKEAQLWTI